MNGEVHMAKKDMASMLDSFESDTTKEHDDAVAVAKIGRASCRERV